MELSAKVVVERQLDDADDMTTLHLEPCLFGKMKVDTNNDDLMLRTMPRYDSEVICSMPKGSEFRCYGFLDADTLKWALGEYTKKDGKIVAGFAHLDYLIKLKE